MKQDNFNGRRLSKSELQGLRDMRLDCARVPVCGHFAPVKVSMATTILEAYKSKPIRGKAGRFLSLKKAAKAVGL